MSARCAARASVVLFAIVGFLGTARGPASLPAQVLEFIDPIPETADANGAADLDWVLRSVDGTEVRLDAYRGRVLFVNLWATWCVPCIAELGSIQRLAASAADTDVAFLLVSPESSDVVATFARRRGIELPVLTEITRAPAAWGVEAVPTSWIVDGAGRIVLKRRGAADWDTDEARALLRWLDGKARTRAYRGGRSRQ